MTDGINYPISIRQSVAGNTSRINHAPSPTDSSAMAVTEALANQNQHESLLLNQSDFIVTNNSNGSANRNSDNHVKIYME